LANWTDLGRDLVGSSLVLNFEISDQGDESAIAGNAGRRGGLVAVMERPLSRTWIAAAALLLFD
jgi:hypothetical protein